MLVYNILNDTIKVTNHHQNHPELAGIDHLCTHILGDLND
jgi:hypothetical protein